MEIAEATDADGEQIIELWKEVGLVRPWNDPHIDLRLARGHAGAQVLVGHAGRQVVCSVLVGFDGTAAGSTTWRSALLTSARVWGV